MQQRKLGVEETKCETIGDDAIRTDYHHQTALTDKSRANDQAVFDSHKKRLKMGETETASTPAVVDKCDSWAGLGQASSGMCRILILKPRSCCSKVRHGKHCPDVHTEHKMQRCLTFRETGGPTTRQIWPVVGGACLASFSPDLSL